MGSNPSQEILDQLAALLAAGEHISSALAQSHPLILTNLRELSEAVRNAKGERPTEVSADSIPTILHVSGAEPEALHAVSVPGGGAVLYLKINPPGGNSMETCDRCGAKRAKGTATK